MAQLQSEVIDVDENFDLKNYLTNQKFTEYSKIETAINNGDLTLDDILECNEQELKETLIGFEISPIERNRFVKAIKKLPKSKIINRFKFGDILNYLQEIVKSAKDLKQRNKIVLKQAQDKLTQIFENEEKRIDTSIYETQKHIEKCQAARSKYEKFLVSKGRDDIDEKEKIIIKHEIGQIRKEMEKFTVVQNELSVNPNDLDNVVNFNSKEFAFNVQQLDWKLSVCGLDDKIKNDGKMFESNDHDCLSRNDHEMSPNSFIYKIEWKIECLNNPDYNGVGICNDHYRQGSQDAKSWFKSLYHIGWNFGGYKNDEWTPHGLLCSHNRKCNNIFYQSCKFVGDNLPSVKRNDIVGLIYNSLNNELLFYLNGQKLNSKLTNIPTNKKLYWFAARGNSHVKFSIVNTSI